MGFAFLPIGIGSLVGGWFGGTLLSRFGEASQHAATIWLVVTGAGIVTTVLLWIYDRVALRSGASTRDDVAARLEDEAIGTP